MRLNTSIVIAGITLLMGIIFQLLKLLLALIGFYAMLGQVACIVLTAWWVLI